jgi:hypothetical protein
MWHMEDTLRAHVCSSCTCCRRWYCRAGGERVEPPPLAELELRLAEAVSREDWDVAVTLRDELKCVATGSRHSSCSVLQTMQEALAVSCMRAVIWIASAHKHQYEKPVT